MNYYPGNDIPIGTDRITGEQVMLTRQDRARHMAVFGSSRTGKSKLLEHMGREDILQWPTDHCPMVLLDPHGTLYENLMAFVVAEGLKEWPIVPVDLSRGDLITSYNLLRRRGGIDPSVVCRAFVDAILFAWGQPNTNQTARLATWLHTLLMLSYEREHTLTEALQIISNPELRRLIARDVQDLVVRSVIQSAEQLREREFQDRVESTLYRINRFLSGQILRATFCQNGNSLDMRHVLDEGQILLVNLSTKGSQIHQEDAAAFGSVMLSDLWGTANSRGKFEEGAIPPCYVYVDEFQNFVGPTIAKGLAEASGFGLHLTLSNQWPSQIIDHGGEVGPLVLNSVLNNAQNQIVFRVKHPEDLEMLTGMLFRQCVNPDLVKDEIISPTVVGYDLQYHKSYTNNVTRGTSHSVQESDSYSVGHTLTNSKSHTVGINGSLGVTTGVSAGEDSGVSDSDGSTDSHTDSHGRSRTESQSNQTTTGFSDSEQWSSGKASGSSDTKSTGNNRGQSLSFHRPSTDFQDDLDDYWNDHFDPLEEDEFKQKWASGMSISEGESSNDSNSTNQSSSSSKGGGRTRSGASSQSRSTSTAENESKSDGTARSRSHSHSKSNQRSQNLSVQSNAGFSLADSESFSEGESEQKSHGTAETFGENESQSHGEGLKPMLMPVFEQRVSSRQFKAIPEQLFEKSKLIDAQRVRECIILLASAMSPQPIRTPIIEPPLTTKEHAQLRTTELIQNLPFVLPFATADQNVRDRQGNLLSKLLNAQASQEPQTSRRRIRTNIVKKPQQPPQ